MNCFLKLFLYVSVLIWSEIVLRQCHIVSVDGFSCCLLYICFGFFTTNQKIVGGICLMNRWMNSLKLRTKMIVTEQCNYVYLEIHELITSLHAEPNLCCGKGLWSEMSMALCENLPMGRFTFLWLADMTNEQSVVLHHDLTWCMHDFNSSSISPLFACWLYSSFLVCFSGCHWLVKCCFNYVVASVLWFLVPSFYANTACVSIPSMVSPATFWETSHGFGCITLQTLTTLFTPIGFSLAFLG